MKYSLVFSAVALFLFCGCGGKEEPYVAPVEEVEAPAQKPAPAEELEIAEPLKAPEPVEPEGVNIDGNWRLAIVGDNPIHPTAANLLYTFKGGKATYVKDDKPEGDGFTYETKGNHLFVTGSKEEGLADTGEDLHHYTVEFGERTMAWSIATPLTATGRQTKYVFERK